MIRRDRIRSTGNLSDDGSVKTSNNDNEPNESASTSTFEQPILVYHESARSIVFRDQLRRAVQKLSIVSDVVSNPSTASHDGNSSKEYNVVRNNDLSETSPTMREATESSNPPTPTTVIAGFTKDRSLTGIGIES